MTMDALTPEGQKFVTDLVSAHDRQIREDERAKCIRAIEQYGLKHVNAMKDYPATTCSVLINLLQSE